MPELFSGLVFRVKNITILIYVSGKIVITGGRIEKNIINAFNKIYDILLQYKKKDFIEYMDFQIQDLDDSMDEDEKKDENKNENNDENQDQEMIDLSNIKNSNTMDLEL